MSDNETENNTQEATDPKVVSFKKTDRVRKTQSHDRLTQSVEAMKPVLQAILGAEIPVELHRSHEQRYARALFDLKVGNQTIEASTAEELLQVINGIRIVGECYEREEKRERRREAAAAHREEKKPAARKKVKKTSEE